MLRIVWLDLNSSYSHTSLALPLLHLSSEARAPCEWHVVRGVTTDAPFALTARIAELEPDIVSSSLYLFNRLAVMEVMARVKTLRPDTITIVGGPECLGDNQDVLSAGAGIDAAFRGEGEAAFPEWLQRVENQENWDGIRGLCFLDVDGRYVDEGMGRPIENVGMPPYPTASRFFVTDRPFVQLETSRGCPHRCDFCTSGGLDSPMRAASLPAVREQLLELQQRGIRDIRVLDRTFNEPPSRCVDLLEMFGADFPDMHFHLEILPESLTISTKRALSDALPGQLHIEAGVQTFSEKARQASHRHGSAEQALAGITFLSSCLSFETHVDLLAGLPQQSWDDVLVDVLAVIDSGAAEIQLESLKILPGTEARQTAASDGVCFAPVPPYEVLRTECMSTKEIAAALALSRMLDRFYNVPHIQPSFIAAVRHNRSFIRDSLTMLCERGLLDEPASMKRRMQAFYEIIPEQSAEARDLLEIGWIRAGLSPSHALAPTHPWKDPLPGGATRLDLICGEGNDRGRSQKIWHVQGSLYDYWAVYGSGSPRNGPASIYHRPK